MENYTGDAENVFTDDIAAQFVRIISKNSPKRDDDAVPKVIKRHGRVISPFPGNLKINGNQIIRLSSGGYMVKHGYRPAPYALYANARSRRPRYIQRSIDEFRAFEEGEGWTERMDMTEFDEE